MYYSIDNKTDKEVGGVFPQVTCNSLHFAHSIQSDEFSYFDSELLFELTKNAKLTDTLSQAAISARGLLVNSKLKELLKSFNLAPHTYYKCNVKDRKGNSHNYHWLHLLNEDILLTAIDYPNSQFYLSRSGFRKNETQLSSFEDYKNKKKDLGFLYSFGLDKLKFVSNFKNTYDLFHIPIFGEKPFVSEVLMKVLKENVVTGIEIEKSDIIVI